MTSLTGETEVQKKDLAAEVAGMAVSGFRLVQILAMTVPAGQELLYSFEKSGDLRHLRLRLPEGDFAIPSVTGTYFAAFTYENEIQDLFGIAVSGLNPDFKGNFYHKAVKSPFAGNGRGGA